MSESKRPRRGRSGTKPDDDGASVTEAESSQTPSTAPSPSGTSEEPQSKNRNGKRPMRELEQGAGGGDTTEDEEDEKKVSKQLSQTQNRRDAMRRVAQSRAAHFARADANDRVRIPPVAAGGGGRSARSTTPLPVAHKAGPAGEPEEQWPGPFATARKMIRERDAAAAARQERLVNGQVLEEGEEDGEAEGLKKFKIDWQPRTTKRPPPLHEVPSLNQLCLDLLIQHVDAIESLGCVTTQVRYQFAEALAKLGKLNPDALKSLVDPGLVEFYLPDCKHLDPASLIAALRTVSLPPPEEEEEDEDDMCPIPLRASASKAEKGKEKETEKEKEKESSLRILRLRWCGRGFGVLAAQALVSMGVAKGLETLELSGLYHLTDEALEALLQSCHRLSTLDMPYKSVVSGRCLRAVAAATTITSLSIAHCAAVDMDAVQSLASLKRMRRLDLSGLKVTDDVLEALLQGNGATLTCLSLASCDQLTDKALTHLSTYCKALSTLDLSHVHALSSAALVSFFTSASCARGLEEVVLSRVDQVNDDVILALAAQSGKHLRRLSVNTCAEVTDVSMAALAKFGGGHLAELDLSFCRKVSDDGLGHVADHCTALRKLSLWGCTQVTERFLKGHSNSNLTVVGIRQKGSNGKTLA